MANSAQDRVDEVAATAREEALAAAGEKATAKAHEETAEAREKAEAKERKDKADAKERKRRARNNALLFVPTALGLWFVFTSLAQIVMRCTPLFGCSLAELRTSGPLGKPEVIAMAITLLTALWVSGRIFLSED